MRPLPCEDLSPGSIRNCTRLQSVTARHCRAFYLPGIAPRNFQGVSADHAQIRPLYTSYPKFSGYQPLPVQCGKPIADRETTKSEDTVIPVKQAVDAALEYIRNFGGMFPDTYNVRLEETEIDDQDNDWLITLSFVENPIT